MNQLKVIDGARTLDGANSGIDLTPISVASANNRSGPGFDMSGHLELLVSVQAGVINTSVVVVVQESNDNSNFTNISGASVNMTATNTHKVMSVNWKHPDRQKYARVNAVAAGGGASLIGVASLRVHPADVVDADDSVTAV